MFHVNRVVLDPDPDPVCLLCAAGLGEFRIRDLNDEINKLLREKGHWEVRIKELGGPDYAVNILNIFTLVNREYFKYRQSSKR